MAAKKESSQQRQTLILWALLGKPGAGAFQNELKPEPTKGERTTLIKQGLVSDRKEGRRIWIEVTDKGWDWAASHLDEPLPANSIFGTFVLKEWLARLKDFMAARGLMLADILAPATAEPPKALPEVGLEERIRQAYLDVTQGRFNTQALLRDIRRRLPDVDKNTLDRGLTMMQNAQKALLYKLDNHFELTDEDRAAALHIGGEPRHILWIER